MRQRREFLNLTQAQLAQALWDAQGWDLDATAITRIERGERRIRLNEAVAIVTVLGLDLYEAIAPHPGDLQEQLDRAQAGLANAAYAEDFWKQERAAAEQRLDELRTRVDQEARDKSAFRERIQKSRDEAEASGDVNALAGYNVTGGDDDRFDSEEG